MSFKQMINRLFFFLFLCLFLISCQSNLDPNRDQSMTDDMENLNIVQDKYEPYLTLEGGPEFVMREPHPVSNNKLQELFPELLFLHGDLKTNHVALTFDDGPDMRYTPKILDVLKKHDVKATFFLIGARAKEHDDIVKRIHDEGHAIGNHTFWHPNLPEEELDRLHWEVTETEHAIEEIVGFKPKLFRSPYGALNEEMLKMLGDLGNIIVGWNVDTLDWKQLSPDELADNALSNVDFGSIILMHDGGDWSMDLSTAEGLDHIISKLKEDKTRFVTVPELINEAEAK